MSKNKGPAAKSAIIASDDLSGSGHLKALFNSTRKRVLFAVVALFVVFLAVLAIVALSNNDKSPARPVSNLQADKEQVSRLRSKQPAANASFEDKQSYLEAIVETEYRARKYDDARQHYEELLTLMKGKEFKNDLSYVQGALVYIELGNKSAARAQLDKAQALDEKIADAEDQRSSLNVVAKVRERIK